MLGFSLIGFSLIYHNLNMLQYAKMNISKEKFTAFMGHIGGETFSSALSKEKFKSFNKALRAIFQLGVGVGGGAN